MKLKEYVVDTITTDFKISLQPIKQFHKCEDLDVSNNKIYYFSLAVKCGFLNS